jgi:hypothetical protein
LRLQVWSPSEMHQMVLRDLDAAKAERPRPRQLKMRRLETGGRTYAAYDAHALLEATDPSHLARPGHPLG